MQGIAGMQVLPISYQKYYVEVQVEICNEVFTLVTLIDTGSDINLLHKNKIPAKYWEPSFGHVTGLENHDVALKYEVPRENILLHGYSIGMRFHIADSPIHCILGTPFLSLVSPHGSCMVKHLPGYFITISAIQHHPYTRIELPFISESHMQMGYLNCMVIVEIFDKNRDKPISHYYADNTPW
jgi:hypothetical protein